VQKFETEALVVAAFYTPWDNTVHLPDTFDPDSMEDKSILLHELVHFLQDLNHIYGATECERERPAYAAQAKWLKDHGVNPSLVGLETKAKIRHRAHCD
jgi:hypothetical protein